MKPTMTACEMYRVKSPRRKSVMPVCTRPMSSANRIAASSFSSAGMNASAAEDGNRDGVGRPVDQLPRGIQQRPDRGHHDGRIKTILRRQARDGRISHGLWHRHRGHRDAGENVESKPGPTVMAQGIERGTIWKNHSRARCFNAAAFFASSPRGGGGPLVGFGIMPGDSKLLWANLMRRRRLV